MTNHVAFWLIAVIGAVFAADYFYFEWNLPLILGHGAVALIDYVAFWR